MRSLLEVQELKLANIVSVKLEEEQQAQLNSIVTSTELLAEWLNQDSVGAPKNFK